MDKGTENRPIVFYDGDCGFCNSSVQFILNKRKKAVYFMPLQDARARQILSELEIDIQMDTLYLMEDKVYERSTAALRICGYLKGGYPALKFFLFVPSFLRDGIYNLIARRRYRLKSGYCVIPTDEEQGLFL